MLAITVGREMLEAENVIGIWGAAGSGKSFLLSKTAFQLSTQMGPEKRCMYVDEKMAEYFEEDINLYLKTFTVLADEQEAPVLVIDNLEVIRQNSEEFYEVLKERVNTGAWSLVYASRDMITDFDIEKNVVLYTFRDRDTFLVNVINPAVNGMEDITVPSYEERKEK